MSASLIMAAPAFLTNAWEYIKGHSAFLIRFALALVLGYILIRLIGSFLGRTLRKSKMDNAIASFIRQLVKIVLSVVWVIILCSLLGVPTTSLIALLSAAALAVSLALQNSFSNVASGFVIIFNHPFKENDFVELAGVSGTVKTINIMSTVIMTPDNKVVTIPNNTIISSNIIDYSTMPQRRVDFTFSVAYGTDVETVKRVVSEVCAAHKKVLPGEEITVRLSAMAASSLDFTARVWTNAADYWTVFFDLNEAVLAAFNSNGISVPFSQLDVHIDRSGN